MKTIFVAFAASILWCSCSPGQSGELTAVETKQTIELRQGDVPFLTYHKTEVNPPEDVDPVFRRSGFIHPVKTPAGAVVTGIHPTDHYHHFGLWHTWVETKHDGVPVDFWNLKNETGRVAYRKTVSVTSGEGVAGFVVEQDHIACQGETKNLVAVLREVFTVNARLVDGAFEIDYDTVQTNVSEYTLELPAYRYGGPIAYRAPHHWKNGNSDYLSSEGKTRLDGHETRSRWISMWGPATKEKNSSPVSFTILGHPANHDAPQRMRVWPPETNDGAIFFNYVPIQEHPWEIKPGKSSTMKYRIVVSDSKPDPKDLNARWSRYAK